jgi:hypothetical protein
MSLTAVYTDLLDAKTKAPKIIEYALEYPIEAAEAYLTAAPFFKTARQIKWELDICLSKSLEEIVSTLLKRPVDEDETITLIFSLKTQTVTEIILHKNDHDDIKYDPPARIQAYIKMLFDGFFANVPKDHVEELEFVVC